MYYVGVDIGGMSLKAGLVDERGVISASKAVPTRAKAPSEEIVSDLAGLVASLLESEGLTVKDIGGIGIGSPGSVNDAAGTVRYSCNINFRMTPIVAMLKEVLGADRVAISNDANCAALGETLFGAGRGAKNSVTVTLGTGIGTGIVADGRLVTGNGSAGAEGGHMCIAYGGELCGCGKRGCYEAYASVSALIRQTERAMEAHPESLMHEIAKEEGVNGKTAFIAMKRGDKVLAGGVHRGRSHLPRRRHPHPPAPRIHRREHPQRRLQSAHRGGGGDPRRRRGHSGGGGSCHGAPAAREVALNFFGA